jgi:hypothetical protein
MPDNNQRVQSSSTNKKRRRTEALKGKTANPNYLRDHERAGKPGIKYHPNRMAMQAAPDHGDHE